VVMVAVVVLVVVGHLDQPSSTHLSHVCATRSAILFYSNNT